MSWPRDDAKLERVRALMAEQELDALVVRAPDNVLYLTNFWGMKGYDAVVFPREGEPVLICLEASEADAERMSWTRRRALLPTATTTSDPRPPAMRALDLARQIASEYDAGRDRALARHAGGRPDGRRAHDLHRRRGSTRSRRPRDATPLLAEARALKTEQEIERMRLANEIAAGAMEHVQGRLRPGMTRARGRRRCGRAGCTTTAPASTGKVELARGFSLVWSGEGIRTFTATGSRPIAGARADAVRDLGLRRRLLVRPHEEPRPGRARRALRRARASSCWTCTPPSRRLLPAGCEPRRAGPA